MIKKLTIVMAALLSTAAIQAQSGTTPARHDTTKAWTLEACIVHAIENNISLKQNKTQLSQDEERLKQSKAALLPSLSFSTNQNVNWQPWSQSYVNLSSGTLTTTSSEVNYHGSYGLNASWTVWNGGRNYKTVKKNRVTNEIAEYDIEQAANTIQEQIAQYYVQILYQTEAVKVCEEVLAAGRLQRDRAKEMVDVGSLARVDLMQLEAQVAQDEFNLVNARTQLASYKLDLKEILEIVGDENFNVAIPIVDETSVMTPLPKISDIYERAYSTRPEIKSGRLNVEASDIDLSIAKRGYLPTLSLNANIGSSNSSGMETSFWQQMKTHLSNSVGMTLSIPLFDGRQNKTNVNIAKLTKENNTLSLRNAEKDLYARIENYHLNATNAQQQYHFAVKNEKSMEESYNLVSEQFRLGLKNIVELTTGKTNLLQAKQTKLQSKYTALLNIAMLRFYQGEPMRL